MEYPDLSQKAASSQFDVVELEVVEGEVTLQANKANVLDAAGGTINITMPTVNDGKENIVRLYVIGTDVTTITFSDVILWDQIAGYIDAATTGEFYVADFRTVDNGTTWLCVYLSYCAVAE